MGRFLTLGHVCKKYMRRYFHWCLLYPKWLFRILWIWWNYWLNYKHHDIITKANITTVIKATVPVVYKSFRTTFIVQCIISTSMHTNQYFQFLTLFRFNSNRYNFHSFSFISCSKELCADWFFVSTKGTKPWAFFFVFTYANYITSKM